MQGLAKPSSRQHSNALSDDMLDGSIPAGRKTSNGSGTFDRVPSASPGSGSPLVLNGVLSLANAGTWLQMLRAKLAPNSPDRRRSDFADVPELRSSTLLQPGLPSQPEADETFAYPEPIRRSRSDALHDRQPSTVHSRRGADLARCSSAGIAMGCIGSPCLPCSFTCTQLPS